MSKIDKILDPELINELYKFNAALLSISQLTKILQSTKNYFDPAHVKREKITTNINAFNCLLDNIFINVGMPYTVSINSYYEKVKTAMNNTSDGRYIAILHNLSNILALMKPILQLQAEGIKFKLSTMK